jgi:hypothetical protein
MLAAQMAVIHTATMTFARRLAMVRAARHAPRDVGGVAMPGSASALFSSPLHYLITMWRR